MLKSRREIIALAVLGLTLALAFVFTPPVLAQQPTPSDDQVNAIAHQLYCPVCENVPLDVCPTQACAQWRELIREKLAAGWSEQQIKNYFVAQYGERVLAAPPRRGLNWLVYILPPLFILGGVYLVYRVLRGSRPAGAAATPLGPPPATPQPLSPDDEYLRRVEEELRKREQA
jgi:cytochrome c-type biogenesis protein CcmH